jgi:phosphoribosylglycinamide formyltransferase 1
MSSPPPRKRIAVLISGRGSNLDAIIKAIEENALPATIALVLSNREDAEGLKIAEEAKIPTEVVNHKLFAKRQDFEMAIHRELVKQKVEFIALAGFMRMFTSWFCDRWANRMVNIHPSLLPAYKGLDTHRRVIEDGTKLHGCTVHFVVHDMDSGPIIAQSAIPVLPDDTPDKLAQKVLEIEHAVYPVALSLLVTGRLKLLRNRVNSGIKASGSITVF